MLELRRLAPRFYDAVLHVELAPEQIPFAGTPQEFLANAEAAVHLHLMLNQGEVVGYFKLDLAYADDYAFCPADSLGLRMFVVDHKRQGQGLGTQAVAALPAYVRKFYPQFHALYLTVNGKNIGAKRCYEKGGFLDTGELYHGGAAGPQHVMKLKI